MCHHDWTLASRQLIGLDTRNTRMTHNQSPSNDVHNLLFYQIFPQSAIIRHNSLSSLRRSLLASAGSPEKTLFFATMGS